MMTRQDYTFKKDLCNPGCHHGAAGSIVGRCYYIQACGVQAFKIRAQQAQASLIHMLFIAGAMYM